MSVRPWPGKLGWNMPEWSTLHSPTLTLLSNIRLAPRGGIKLGFDINGKVRNYLCVFVIDIRNSRFARLKHNIQKGYFFSLAYSGNRQWLT
jgi:hypothetical protein